MGLEDGKHLSVLEIKHNQVLRLRKVHTIGKMLGQPQVLKGNLHQTRLPHLADKASGCLPIRSSQEQSRRRNSKPKWGLGDRGKGLEERGQGRGKAARRRGWVCDGPAGHPAAARAATCWRRITELSRKGKRSPVQSMRIVLRVPRTVRRMSLTDVGNTQEAVLHPKFGLSQQLLPPTAGCRLCEDSTVELGIWR